MLRRAVGLFLLVGSFSAVAEVRHLNTDSGAFLYEACQLRITAMNDANATLTPRDASRALMCDSYFEGFIDGAISSGGYCLHKVTREDAIREYVAFMTKNPFFLKEDKIMSIALVLQPLFKCPTGIH